MILAVGENEYLFSSTFHWISRPFEPKHLDVPTLRVAGGIYWYKKFLEFSIQSLKSDYIYVKTYYSFLSKVWSLELRDKQMDVFNLTLHLLSPLNISNTILHHGDWNYELWRNFLLKFKHISQRFIHKLCIYFLPVAECTGL